LITGLLAIPAPTRTATTAAGGGTGPEDRDTFLLTCVAPNP
jgi:hypothetical protein